MKGIGAIGWLVILAIAFFVVPQLFQVIAASTRRAVLPTDPVAVADAIVARDLWNMR